MQPDVWITIYVRDLAASIAFYASLPGFEEVYRQPDRAGFRRGGTEFILVEQQDVEAIDDTEAYRLAITVPTGDVEADFNKHVAQGAEALEDPMDLENGDRSAWIADPDGAPIQLLQKYAREHKPGWHTVSSSMIDQIAWRENGEVLCIRFLNGRTYEYFDVPQAVFDRFLDAESKGTYFREYILDMYEYQQVVDAPRRRSR